MRNRSVPRTERRSHQRPAVGALLAIVALLGGACGFLPGQDDAADTPDAITIVESADGSASGGSAATCQAGSGADYRNQVLIDADYEGDLSCADFGLSTLTQPDFTGVVLDGATFAGANLAQPKFVQSSARDADFSGATLSQPVFVGSDLTGANFTGAVVVQASYEDTICPNGTNSDVNGGSCPVSSELVADTAATAEPADTAPADTVTGDEAADGSGAPSTEAEAPPDGAAADPILGCVGRYTGQVVGIVTVDVGGSLDETGLFVVDFSDVLGSDEQAAGLVSPDGSVVFTSILGGEGRGSFDWSTCTAAGTWTGEVGDSGTWNFEPAS